MAPRRLRRIWYSILSGLLLTVCACGPDSSAPEEAVDDERARLSADNDASEERRHEVSRHFRERARGDGLPFEHVDQLSQRNLEDVYVAENESQRFLGVFAEQRLELEPYDPSADAENSEPTWTLALELSSWGREGRSTAASKPIRHLADRRLEYRRDDLVEWYRHDEHGIEHGFDVLAKPAGAGPLRFEVAFNGTLQPRLAGEDAVNLLSDSGEYVLRYGGLFVYDADGAEVDARFEISGGMVAIVIDDRNARYPLVVDPQVERRKLVASDGASGDYFGSSVAVSGDVAVAGAPYHVDIIGAHGAGAAYLFERDRGGAGNWGQAKKLTTSDGANGDLVGKAASMSGDVAVIGAPQHDTNGTYNAGAAYIFGQDHGGAGNWGEVKKLIASDAAGADTFGSSVSASGDVALVGAPNHDINSNVRAGAAYVFERDNGGVDNWGEVTKLFASDGAASDSFGSSVSVSGDVAVVGAPDQSINNNSWVGAAYIFERDEGGADNWGEVAKLTASDGGSGDLFGSSVSISGDTAVVAAYRHGQNGAKSGAAYVFERDHGGADNWGQVKKLIGSDVAARHRFGFSLSVSGDVAVVGAYGDNQNGGSAGAAYVFERDRGGADNWGELIKVTASDGATADHFGRAVAVSGHTAMIGALNDDAHYTSDGSAYITYVPNLPPVAADDSATTTEDTSVTIDVLANDSEPDGDALTVMSVTNPADGSVVNNGSDITFFPNADYNGSDSFDYTVTDDKGGIDTATVIVTTTPINDPPMAEDDSATTDEDVSATIDVLANDSDVDGDALTITNFTQPSSGTVTSSGPGFTYSPVPDFNGSDAFTYTISDGNGSHDTASVNITITPINDPPVAEDDTVTTDEDTRVRINVLANDSDIDGDTLNISSITQPSNGHLANHGSETAYTPDLNFNGTDRFEYTVHDGNGRTASAAVDIVVEAINDMPVAVDDSATTHMGRGIAIDVLANDSDVEDDALSMRLETQPQYGTAGVILEGRVLYGPEDGFIGEDRFDYRVLDTDGGSTVATVTVSVEPPPWSCDAVTCDAAETCFQGECFPACTEDVDCPESGQHCFDGRCASEPCERVVCPDEESCYDGECSPRCERDADCVVPEARCIQNTCVIESDEPDTGSDDAGDDTDSADAGSDSGVSQGQSSAGEGCGCSSSGRTANNVGVVLVFIGIWVLRIRRRGRKSD